MSLGLLRRLFGGLQQRLFRWRSDGTAPLRLNQRRVFILPTRAGLLYALTLIVMLTGAINYNLALGHALVFLLAGLGIVGMVHTFRNLHGLIIAPIGATPVFAGETAYFELQIDNDRTSARPGLVFSAEPGQETRVTGKSKNRAKSKIPLSTHQRGWLALPRVRLSTRYPLGLFNAWAYLQPELRCLVYPRPLYRPLPAPQAISGNAAASHQSGNEDFAGFRDRQSADPLHHVAWKASARRAAEAPLLIKQFAGGADQELQLDWAMTDPADDVDTRLGVLTGWVMAAESEGLSYGLELPGCRIAISHGHAHQQRCLEALALATV